MPVVVSACHDQESNRHVIRAGKGRYVDHRHVKSLEHVSDVCERLDNVFTVQRVLKIGLPMSLLSLREPHQQH